MTDDHDNEPQDGTNQPDAGKKPPIVLVQPPKDIDEMSDAELDDFASRLWQGVTKSGD